MFSCRLSGGVAPAEFLDPVGSQSLVSSSAAANIDALGSEMPVSAVRRRSTGFSRKCTPALSAGRGGLKAHRRLAPKGGTPTCVTRHRVSSSLLSAANEWPHAREPARVHGTARRPVRHLCCPLHACVVYITIDIGVRNADGENCLRTAGAKRCDCEGMSLRGNEVFVRKYEDIVILFSKRSPWAPLMHSLDEFTDDFMAERNQPEPQERKGL